MSLINDIEIVILRDGYLAIRAYHTTLGKHVFWNMMDETRCWELEPYKYCLLDSWTEANIVLEAISNGT